MMITVITESMNAFDDGDNDYNEDAILESMNALNYDDDDDDDDDEGDDHDDYDDHRELLTKMITITIRMSTMMMITENMTDYLMTTMTMITERMTAFIDDDHNNYDEDVLYDNNENYHRKHECF